MNPSYKIMILDAIASRSYFGRGVTRQAIAKYIQSNHAVSTGTRFTCALRNALKSGIKTGIIVFGKTKQRFKTSDDGRKLRNRQKGSSRKKKGLTRGKKRGKLDKSKSQNVVQSSMYALLDFCWTTHPELSRLQILSLCAQSQWYMIGSPRSVLLIRWLYLCRWSLV